jgi:Cu-Zn family superoxide dismutase
MPSAVLTLRSCRVRFLAVATCSAVAAFVAFASVAAAQEPPDPYALPGEAVFPEGIALDGDAGVLYVGSTSDGTIFRADIASGDVEVFASGSQPTAIGMTLDPYGRLWVAGGPTGRVFVYDTASGELLGDLATPDAEATFLNDAVWVDDAVYVTDSFRPELFRIGAGPELGEVTSFVSFEGSDFAYLEGFNANGIAVAPDGSGLVIAQSATGLLYRVDLASREVSQVASTPHPAADGLVIHDEVLYVVKNRSGEINRRGISEDGTVAVRPVRGGAIESERFHYPTTAAIHDGSIFVVNAQFDRQDGAPELPFEVVCLPLP